MVQSVADMQPYLPWARLNWSGWRTWMPQTDDERRQRLHAQSGTGRPGQRTCDSAAGIPAGRNARRISG